MREAPGGSWSNLVSRPRLSARLDGALKARVTVVTGAAGFGKTSAVADWLRGVDAVPVWVALERGDSEPARFMRTVLDAAAGRRASASPPVSAPRHTLEPAEVAAEIVDCLMGNGRATILVLDDFHVLTGPVIAEVVQELIELAPQDLHLVIASRADPPLRLSRLRAGGAVLDIRGDDLRFTPGEASEFLSARMGLDLAAFDVTALVERTEGWPAALQLAALSMTGHGDASAFVQNFSGSNRLVLDYVTEEVLDRLDPATSEFLLQTCVLDRLEPGLCDAVTGRSDSAVMLDQLERRNVLLVPLDPQLRAYRYHQLFSDLLRMTLVSRQPHVVAQLNERAARWYLAHGQPQQALAHAVEVGSLEQVGDIVFSAVAALVHEGYLRAAGESLDRLPRRVTFNSARIAAVRAWVSALLDEPDVANEWLAHAAAAARRSGGDADALTALIQGHALMIRSTLARLGRRPDEALELARLAVTQQPRGLDPGTEDTYRGDSLTVLGHALLASGDVNGAMTSYREAVGPVERAGNRLAAADMVLALARHEASQGRLQAGLAICQRAATARAGNREGPADAPIRLGEAEILVQLGDPRAAAVARKAHDLARLGGDLSGMRQARALESAAACSGAQSGQILSPREMQVLSLVAAGRSNREIAQALFVSVGTVKSHMHAIAVALGTANRTESVARARELALIA